MRFWKIYFWSFWIYFAYSKTYKKFRKGNEFVIFESFPFIIQPLVQFIECIFISIPHSYRVAIKGQIPCNIATKPSNAKNTDHNHFRIVVCTNIPAFFSVSFMTKKQQVIKW